MSCDAIFSFRNVNDTEFHFILSIYNEVLPIHVLKRISVKPFMHNENIEKATDLDKCLVETLKKKRIPNAIMFILKVVFQDVTAWDVFFFYTSVVCQNVLKDLSGVMLLFCSSFFILYV